MPPLINHFCMPFTFCHPAIILPFLALKRSWFSVTGLIVGSMGPDLEYFTRMKILATYGHDWIWGLVLGIPLGYLYSYVYHNWVRNCFIDALPNFLQQRFSTERFFNWNSYVNTHFWMVLSSLIIGFYSHLFWDAFTHEWGFFVELWPVLATDLMGFPIYKILQHGSTWVGALILLTWVCYLPKNKNIVSGFCWSYWTKVCGIGLSIAACRFILFPGDMVFGNILVTIIMGGFIGMIIIGFRRKKYS